MSNDSTDVLDKHVGKLALPPQGTADERSSLLDGHLVVDGIEFSWQARSLYGVWFVGVSSATCGSRSQLTQDDPLVFASQLARQVTRQQLEAPSTGADTTATKRVTSRRTS